MIPSGYNVEYTLVAERYSWALCDTRITTPDKVVFISRVNLHGYHPNLSRSRIQQAIYNQFQTVGKKDWIIEA